ncbi:hypothetical protein AVEN_247485-1 [Araneus ventricosus]|uniref:Uncharacterized protein n=1 Tax=Araneus ventricosus TaxID=182803 RepID=A0A4Y2GY96_ARAVE|nr:hypothetical protein AVEN_247485-1 [Araneus ventricosus]
MRCLCVKRVCPIRRRVNLTSNSRRGSTGHISIKEQPFHVLVKEKDTPDKEYNAGLSEHTFPIVQQYNCMNTMRNEGILLLIGLDAAEGLDIAESESMPKVYVIPRVDENPASPTSGSSYAVSNELNTQP